MPPWIAGPLFGLAGTLACAVFLWLLFGIFGFRTLNIRKWR